MDVAGSAVGIASLGIQICQGLFAYYDSWKDYTSDIRSTRDSIEDLSRTLVLLKTSLDGGELDVEKSERVKRCLQSSEEGLIKLSKKAEKLRSYGEPEGFRQKTWTELQRLWYPARASTLAKVREIVDSILERLKLAVQVLHLDVSTSSKEMLMALARRTETIEASVSHVSAQSQGLLDAQQSDHVRKIMNWLSAADPWTNHKSARQRHEPQTGKWFLQSDQYLKWKVGPPSRMWLYGDAGCGKTVLCSTIIEDIRLHCEKPKGSGCGIFYFSFSDNQKQSYENLLRSLIIQLGWKEPCLSMLSQAYGKSHQGLPGTDELEKMLLTSFNSYDNVFLLLDALDECPERDELRQRVLEGLEMLAQEATNVKMLATSRKLSDIRRSMNMLGAEPICLAALAVDADISRYISSELARDWRFDPLDLDTKTLIEKTLSQKASGMFRWVYCQLQELKKLKSFKPKYVEKALISLSPTLDETYERMLNGIEEMFRKEALTLLQWLAYAQSPLSLAQLAEAAIVDPTADVEVDVNNRGNLEDTLEILAGLVAVEDNSNLDSLRFAPRDREESKVRLVQRNRKSRRVNFAHFSVQEYLESKRILQSNAKDFFIESGRGHALLAQSCLTYLSYYSTSNAKTSTEQDLDTYPLLNYAARAWFGHAYKQQVGDNTRIIALLSSETHKRDWLRVHQPDLYIGQFSYVVEVAPSLYYASLLGLESVVAELLQGGVDVNGRGGYYGTALQAASHSGHEQIVQLLILEGADVNAQGGLYGHALEAASAGGHNDIVYELLEKGAKINAQGHNGATAIQQACYYGHKEIVQLLLDEGADIHLCHKLKGDALESASNTGDEKLVRLLLDEGASVNKESCEYGRGALCAASGHGHEKIVALLLSRGALVNAQGSHGGSLQEASFGGHEKTVRLLLANGANIDAQLYPLGTALQAASYRGHEKIVRLLLDQGADININAPRSVWGTALQAASFKGFEDITQLLLHKGANTNIFGGAMECALQAAASRGHKNIVLQLLSKGADIDARGGRYGSALQAAIANGHTDVAELLEEKGATVPKE